VLLLATRPALLLERRVTRGDISQKQAQTGNTQINLLQRRRRRPMLLRHGSVYTPARPHVQASGGPWKAF
jgi:hypothetical protein